MVTIGGRVRTARKALGLTQPVLAKTVGIDQSTLSDIERGSGFSAEVLMRLADALELSAEQIMRGADSGTWPFPRIPIARFLALSDPDRAYVEGRLEQAIETCELAQMSPEENRLYQAITKQPAKTSVSRKKSGSRTS